MKLTLKIKQIFELIPPLYFRITWITTETNQYLKWLPMYHHQKHFFVRVRRKLRHYLLLLAPRSKARILTTIPHISVHYITYIPFHGTCARRSSVPWKNTRIRTAERFLWKYKKKQKKIVKNETFTFISNMIMP